MASSGKKGKKSKGKTVTLTDFLQETPGVQTLPVKKYNWSEEVEDAFDGFESRPKPTVALPTAPRAARGPDISEDRIPNHPPYIAYISNLPYDVEEEDIAMFFGNMTIASMRLPRDDRGGESGKLKGFGYVEFEDRTSLIDAISIIDTNLKGRRIKIDVATSSDTDRRRGGRMDMGRDRPERPEVTMSDWRSGPRDQPTMESRDNRGGGFRDRDGGDSNRVGAWRDNMDRGGGHRDDRDRERGNYRGDYDRERGGGGGFRDSDRDRDRYRDSDRERGGYRDSERGGFRDSDRDRGYSDRGRYGDRDRDRDDRRGFGPRRNYGDRDRDGDREGFRKDEDREQPRSRPKLVLAPRTKPLEEQAPSTTTTEPEATTSAPLQPATSIFGSAKPVDTSQREREIEERLAKEKETRPSIRDGSRDKNKDDEKEEEKPVKKEAWGRKRNDDDNSGADRRDSPDRRPSSRGPPPRKNDDRRPGPGGRDRERDRERAPQRRDDKPKREDRPPREHEKEMPKLKEPEPPNFAASNKFATLEEDTD